MSPVCEICGDDMFLYTDKLNPHPSIGAWCCVRKEFPAQPHPPVRKSEFSYREELLKEAEQIITRDRNNNYGEPDQDFKRTAAFWNLYLGHKSRPNAEELEAFDVAVLMILLKISRLSWNPTHKDSWLDIAGYAACGYETMKLNEEK